MIYHYDQGGEVMINDDELTILLTDIEADWVERKGSISEPGKIRQAICAYANDMPGNNKPGVIFIGAKDDGTTSGLTITEELLLTLSDMRSDGNILPIPSMTVQKKKLEGYDLAVIIVEPSLFPPVRFKGQVWIRVGPRRAIASAQEEYRLTEKRKAKDLPYDLNPITNASVDDLDKDLFSRTYLPSAVAVEVLQSDQRTVEQQMVSVRFLYTDGNISPTVVGLLAVGKQPAAYIPGSYIQFLRIEGVSLTDPIADQKEIHGPLPDMIRNLDEILKANIRIPTDIRSSNTEVRHPDYPIDALQQLSRNAVMHRDYAMSNAPVRITWFADRIEIQNPGGPFGQVTRTNFGKPGITDYRNPNIAEVMRNLGFVQRFGVGIQIARKALLDNTNPEPVFDIQDNHILVTIRRRV